MARNAFAEFLIARRAELRPADVGMPGGGRRRTPGLRREEVAVRAGVSADYLARLEQGRDTNPSAAVIDALADALLLSSGERQHLVFLGLTSSNESRCPGNETAEEQIPETIETILRALDPTPAFVIGRQLNVLGWNGAWAEFATPLGLLDDAANPPNLAWYTFMHPVARRVLRDWPAAADTFAALLRRASLRWPGDETLRDTITALRRHPEFDERWKPHRIAEPGPSVLHFEHPEHGAVEVPFETLDADRDQSVVVWLTRQTEAKAPALRLVHNRAANA